MDVDVCALLRRPGQFCGLPSSCLLGGPSSGLVPSCLPGTALDLPFALLEALLDAEHRASGHGTGVVQPGVVLAAQLRVGQHPPSRLERLEVML